MRSASARVFRDLTIALVIAYYLMPILSITMASFTLQWNKWGIPGALGLSGYREFWNTPEFRRSLWVSLEIAPITVVLTILTVAPAAYAIHISASRALKNIADIFVTIPLCLPSLILAVGLLQAYGSRPIVLTGTIWIVILGHIVLSSPFMYRSVSANLQMIGTRTLVEAARSCGASQLRTLLKVIIPSIGPGIASGSLLTFTTSFGEYQLSKMVSGFANQTFPIKIWEASKRVTRIQFAMSFLAIVLAFAAFLAITVIFSRSKIREERIIA